MSSSKKSGTIAIIGRPNVGKSTLINTIIGEKISIVSRKAQTTRHRIIGIRSEEDAQFVFVDTPGYQKKYTSKLNSAMNRNVLTAIADVDVVVLVVEAGKWTSEDDKILQIIPSDKPLILAINKADRLSQTLQMINYLQKVAALRDFTALVPISASKAWQTTQLSDEIKKHLPNEGFLYSPDELTDRDDRFFAAEFIREKLFRLLGDELPYAATVEIEQFEREGELRRIFAAIIVDRENHKAIILGKGGQHLKRIASEARQDFAKLYDCPVYLEVWVKVRSGWANNEQMLQQLGMSTK